MEFFFLCVHTLSSDVLVRLSGQVWLGTITISTKRSITTQHIYRYHTIIE